MLCSSKRKLGLEAGVNSSQDLYNARLPSILQWSEVPNKVYIALEE
jgi:hypothetical protein